MIRNKNNIDYSDYKELLQNPDKQISKIFAEEIAFLKRDKIPYTIITIATGSCGIISGAYKTLDAIKDYINVRDIKAEVIETGCFGLCSEEPVIGVQIPGKSMVFFKKVKSDVVDYILDAVFSNDVLTHYALFQLRKAIHQPWEDIPFMEELPFFAGQSRNVLRDCGLINPLSINEYIARGGYKAFIKSISNYTVSKVCEIIEESGLRGRGGGGFSTGLKWETALLTPGNNKYIVCNADESDPGAFISRNILEGDPHRLLEGILIAAYAVGANKAFIYLRVQHETAFNRISKAIEDAKNMGLIGYNIFDSGVNINIIVKQSPGAYVCGEETALIASLEGKRGTPVTKPPYPAVKGIAGLPTVVNNVETLANIRNIVDKGPVWFKSIGTEKSKGTKLFSLSGKIKNSGVIEVEMGTSLKEIVFGIGGGIKDDRMLKALLIGGPSGYFLPEQKLDIEIDYEKMREAGISLGSGGLLVIDDTNCIVDITKYFLNYVAKESCGKCIPCREGTKIMSDILDLITRRPVNSTSHETLERFKGVMQLEPLADVIQDTALCGLGKNAPNPLISSMKWFRKEYEEHIFDRKCSANVCKQIRCFSINTFNCTGCNACVSKCPEKAIIGVALKPHFIIPDKCTGCGICYEICKFSAIFVV